MAQYIPLYYGLSYIPQIASWGFSNIVWPIVGIVYSKWKGEEKISELPPLQKDIFEKLQRGELRLYEVSAPSTFDNNNGIHTRYLILETTKTSTYKSDEPVFL
jgi:hypothetical protein